MDTASKDTRKKIIEIKYKNLVSKLQPVLPDDYKNIFPSLDELDLLDAIYWFNVFFCDSTDKYKNDFKTFLIIKGAELDEETFEKVYALVLPFIDFLKLHF